MKLVAVDPGDLHVGIATWSSQEGIRSNEVSPEECCQFVDLLDEDWTLIVEEFRLYPTKASAQSWSPMLTAELIGALKWIARQKRISVVLQPAYIKVPTLRRCTAKRLEWKVRSVHESDARLHLFYYLLRRKLV